MTNVLVINLCFQIKFLIDHHCKTQSEFSDVPKITRIFLCLFRVLLMGIFRSDGQEYGVDSTSTQVQLHSQWGNGGGYRFCQNFKVRNFMLQTQHLVLKKYFFSLKVHQGF